MNREITNTNLFPTRKQVAYAAQLAAAKNLAAYNVPQPNPNFATGNNKAFTLHMIQTAPTLDAINATRITRWDMSDAINTLKALPNGGPRKAQA